ncbi:hypothetical protein D3C86_2233680 [compost metagenome]
MAAIPAKRAPWIILMGEYGLFIGCTPLLMVIDRCVAQGNRDGSHSIRCWMIS